MRTTELREGLATSGFSASSLLGSSNAHVDTVTAVVRAPSTHRRFDWSSCFMVMNVFCKLKKTTTAAAAARLEQCNRPVILIGCEFPDVHRDSSVSPNSCEFIPDHQLFSSAPWFTVSAAVCLLHCDSASVPVQRFSPDSNTFSNDALVPVPELLCSAADAVVRGPAGTSGGSWKV